MNAIELLKNDHKKIRALLSELESTTARAASRRPQLVDEIERELTIHARIEEEIFYPAFKEAGEKAEDDKMYFEALEEHRAAEDLVLPDLKKTDPSTEQFSGRAKVLKELIEHHAREEEKEMFPRARKLLSAAELRELGAAMARLKADLLPGPAPKGAMTSVKGLLGSVFSAFAASPSDKKPNGSHPAPRATRADPKKTATKATAVRKSPANKSSAKKSSPNKSSPNKSPSPRKGAARAIVGRRG